MASGGVVVRAECGRILVALTRERGFDGYFLPKGGVEPGETLLAAARREIHEETGISDLTLVRKLGVVERLTLDRRYWSVIHFYLFRTRQVEATPLDAANHPGMEWVVIDELSSMFWPDQRQVIDRHREEIARALAEVSEQDESGTKGMAKRLDLRVRMCRDADLEALCEAHLDAIMSISSDVYSQEQLREWTAPVNPQKYRDAIEQGAALWVAESDDGQLLGFSESHQVDDDRYNAAVFVRGDARRRGVGTAVYKAAEAHALACGAGSIELNASLAAVEFYRRNGFVELGQFESQMPSRRGLAVIKMRKSLKE